MKGLVFAFLAGWAAALVFPVSWTAPVVIIVLCIAAILRIGA